LSDSFPIQSGLKQGDALSPLLFNFALNYAIRKVQENQVLLTFADDVNVLRDNMHTIKKKQKYY
jgi:hypothetical protein